MDRHFDVLIIGTGTAAYNVAHPCAKSGLKVAVVDARTYGGTCALRGCQPKKYLVEAARVVRSGQDLQGKGVARPGVLDWGDLMAAKRRFTEAVPGRTEHGFEKAGITQLQGRARFVDAETVALEGRDAGQISARHVVIATGAVPRPLDMPGAELLMDSEAFLELDSPPASMVCVGGGYISLEFAHVAAAAGTRVTVLQRGDHLLGGFDADLVAKLEEASRAAGIEVVLNAEVAGIGRKGDGLVVRTTDGAEYAAAAALHGAGRVPALENLDLEAAGIEESGRGVLVDAGLRSTSCPSVFAVGDAAASVAMLAPVADLSGAVAAENIIAGGIAREFAPGVVPSVVFTHPSLASVGMTAAEAKERGDEVIVNTGDMSRFPTYRRLGQEFAMYKTMQSAADGRVLGAHILADHAGEMINLLALAIRAGWTGAQFKGVPWAYPTHTSDLKYMFEG